MSKMSLAVFNHFLNTSLGPKCQRFKTHCGSQEPRQETASCQRSQRSQRNERHLLYSRPVPVDQYHQPNGTTEQTAEGNTFIGRKPGSLQVPILVSHCDPWLLESVLM